MPGQRPSCPAMMCLKPLMVMMLLELMLRCVEATSTASQEGMWMYSSKCQKKPRWSEFRDSVFTVFTQRSQPLAPSVDICLHMYEQRRVELQQCSAAVYSVSCCLPSNQNVDSFQIHNTRITLLSPSPAAKPGCQECSHQSTSLSSSSSHQRKIYLPSLLMLSRRASN